MHAALRRLFVSPLCRQCRSVFDFAIGTPVQESEHDTILGNIQAHGLRLCVKKTMALTTLRMIRIYKIPSPPGGAVRSLPVWRAIHPKHLQWTRNLGSSIFVRLRCLHHMLRVWVYGCTEIFKISQQQILFSSSLAVNLRAEVLAPWRLSALAPQTAAVIDGEE